MRLSATKPRVWIALAVVGVLWALTVIRHVGGPLSWGMLAVLLFAVLVAIPDEKEAETMSLRDWLFWAVVVGGVLWVFFATPDPDGVPPRPY